MFVVVQIGTEFGKGYFVGFQKGHAYFQSCYDKHVKVYQTTRGAANAISKITGQPVTFRDTANYKIVSTLSFI